MIRRQPARFRSSAPPPCRRTRGFSLITAIFLLVVLAALGGFMVVFTGLQQTTIQADVQGVRAYYAARAGINWALYRALDPDNTIVSPPSAVNFAPCPTGTVNTMTGTLAPYTVVVGCSETATTEANRNIHIYEITATACNQAACPAPSPPPASYVERRVTVTVAKCKDPSATGPGFDC